MKYKRVILAIASALLTSGCQGCSGAGQSSGADLDAVAAVDSTSDATVNADVDAGSLDAELQPDVPDGASDVDTVDGPDDATAVVPAECQQGQPMPGEPCTKLGEVRCTNFGINQPPINKYIACARPNTVVCQVDAATGGLLWQLVKCPGNSGNCTGGFPQYCSTGLSGEKCAPVAILPEVTPKSGSLGDMLATSIQQCSGVFSKPNSICADSVIHACTTVDKLSPEIKTGLLQALGKCAEGLQDVPYRLPVELCPNDEILCKISMGTGSTPPQYTSRLLSCVLDSATKQPKCAKTCADMGIKEVP